MCENNNSYELEALNGLISQYIEQHCSKETASLVRFNVNSHFGGQKTSVEVVEYQIEQLAQYLLGRNKSLQGIVTDLRSENQQLHLDNQKKLKAREEIEALVQPVQQENSQLRELLKREGSSTELIERLVGERHSQEKEDLDSALRDLRNLQIKYKRLEQEYETAQDTSLYHKEPTASTSKDAEYTAVYTKIMTPQPQGSTMEQITSRVKNMIPPFSGEEGVGLESAVHKFVLGCDNLKASISTELERKTILKAVMMRLHGDAFELAYSSGINTLDELVQVIKNNYSRKRTLDSVTDEMRGTIQRRGEDLNHFARRLKSLHTEATQIVKRYYTTDSTVFEKELTRRLAEQFVTGIANPSLKTIMLTDTSEDFNSLVENAVIKEVRLTSGSGGSICCAYNPSQTFLNQVDCYPGQSNSHHIGRSSCQSQLSESQIQANFQNNFSQTQAGLCLSQCNNHSMGMGNSHVQHGVPMQMSNQNLFNQNGINTETRVGQLNEPHVPIQMNYTTNNNKQPKDEGENLTVANITCSYCNHKGHVWDDCFIRRNTPGGSGQNWQNNNAGRSGRSNNQKEFSRESGKCYYCGKPGHFAANCYQKQRDTGNRNTEQSRSNSNPFKSAEVPSNPICYWCGGHHFSTQCHTQRQQTKRQSEN